MAKAIIAIKCPQCGSTKQRRLENKNYQCLSCDTEYMIDSDDITVNINHSSTDFSVYSSPKIYRSHYSADQIEQPESLGWPRIVVGIVIFSFLASALGFTIYKIANKDTQQSQSTQVTETQAKKLPMKESINTLVRHTIDGFDMASPIQIKVQERFEGKYPTDKNNLRYQLNITELLTEKQLGSIDLTEYLREFKLDPRNTQKTVALHYFDHDHFYLVLFSRKVFQIDLATFTMKEVTNTIFSNFQALDSGVASITPQRDSNQNYFIILANNGETYYVYPIVNKILNKDEQYKQSRGRESLSKEAKEITSYTFTSKSLELRDSIIQLIKYRRMSDFGAPEISLDKPNWTRTSDAKNVFVGKHNQGYSLFNYDTDRVNYATDLTPERKYFDPSVLAWNDQFVLIQDQINVAKDSGYVIQALNSETGKPIWSLESPARKYLLRFKDGFILFDNYENDEPAKLVDFEGNIIKEVKLTI